MLVPYRTYYYYHSFQYDWFEGKNIISPWYNNTKLSKSIDFFPFPKNPREISPSRIILLWSGTKKTSERSLTRSPPSEGEDLSLEISRFFFRKREEINGVAGLPSYFLWFVYHIVLFCREAGYVREGGASWSSTLGGEVFKLYIKHQKVKSNP